MKKRRKSCLRTRTTSTDTSRKFKKVWDKGLCIASAVVNMHSIHTWTRDMMCMHTRTCMHTHAYMCIHVHAHTHTHTCSHIHTNAKVPYTYIHADVSTEREAERETHRHTHAKVPYTMQM